MKTEKYTDRFGRDFLIFYTATLIFFSVGVITTLGLDWYGTLQIPAWTPPVLVVASIWGTLFITTVVSLSIFCDEAVTDTKYFRNTTLIYMGNALLILLWNYLFFGIHLLVPAVWVAVAVGLSVLVLMMRVAITSRIAAWLLVPYLLWAVYAVSINYAVMLMN